MKRKLFEIFKVLTMCMIALIPSSNSLPFHHNHCKTDLDCNQPNFYCYESRECVECTNCSVYNRQMSTVTKCAKNKDQCGNCISGMEAVDNFDGTFTCQPIFNQITTIHSNSDQNPPITTTTTTLSSTTDENHNLWLYISIPSILICAACLAVVKKYKLWTVFQQILPLNYQNCPDVPNNNNNNNNNILPSNPPPPYSEKSPSAPPEEDPLIQRRILHDDNQCTIPFHNPDYVRGGSLSESYPPPNIPEVPTAIDDENTQPSTWSPVPQNSNDLSNQRTSFEDILSTTNPSEQANGHFEQSTNHNPTSDSSNRNPQSLHIHIDLTNTNINNTQIINEI